MEQSAETALRPAIGTICHGLGGAGSRGEGLGSSVLVSILLPIVDLLLESLGLLLVCKRQSCEAVLEFEGMKECPVLVVLEVFVDLLIPDDASVRWLFVLLLAKDLLEPPPSYTYRHIDQLNPVRIANQIVCQDRRPL
jgi:hypothetical protein